MHLIKLITFYLLITMSSCVSKDVHKFINSTIDNIDQYETISHFSDQKWGNIGDITDFNPLKGYCKFKFIKTDTVIGAHYSIGSENSITISYNGTGLSLINYNDSTLTITDLIKYPYQRKYIESKMLFSFSVVYIYNMLKTVENNKYEQVKFLKDTLIGGEKCKKIFLRDDGTGDEIKDDYYMTYEIAISASKLLPMHYKSVAKTPYGTQILENSLSNYKLNDETINDQLFVIGDAPESFETIFFTTKSHEKKEPVLKINMQAPDWEHFTVYDELVSNKDLKGKISLLVFSGVHCGFCLVAVPKLNNIQSKFDNEKFRIYSFYADEEKDKLKKYVERYDINYTLLYDREAEQKGQTTREKYGVSGIPHFILIDKNGNVGNIWIGYSLDIEMLITEAIEKLME